MTHAHYRDILRKHLKGTSPPAREYDAYGPVPSDAEIAAINAATAEYLAGKQLTVVASVFENPIFDGPEFEAARKAWVPRSMREF